MRKKWFFGFWIGFVAFCAILLVLFFQRIQMFYLPSGSMSPTLIIGDRVLVDKHAYSAQAPLDGDVAIFKVSNQQLYPNTPGNSGSVDFIKRVVGVPGERVEMKKGVLYVNGKAMKESYITWSGGPKYDMKVMKGIVYNRYPLDDGSQGYWTQNGVIASQQDQKILDKAASEPLPTDKFLALGDNRGNSNDSHIMGFVDRKDFVGRVFELVLPLARSRKF